MDQEFTREWTYRTPLVTITYPKGWKGPLPDERKAAAKADKALVGGRRKKVA